MKNRTSVLLVFFLIICSLFFSGAQSAASPARIADRSGILTSDQFNSLTAAADSVSLQYGCDVAVVFDRYVPYGKTAEQAADDYFDYNGYGLGAGRNGILLFVATSGREYAISTHGTGIRSFTDAGLAAIVDSMLPYLRESNWSRAADTFISQCGRFLRQAETGAPYDIGNMPRKSVSLAAILGDTALGVLLAGLPLRKKKKEMETVSSRANAQDYLLSGTFRVTASDDRFITKTMSRIPIHTDSHDSSGGMHSGGSSVHISSSGSTHGGTSGRF